MSLELAIQANTAALHKLIEILGTIDDVLPQAQTNPQPTQAPTPQANVTVAQCQAAAAEAVVRLGSTPEAKQTVKDVIAKHGASTIPKLNQLQLNACHDELDKL